MKKSFIAKLDQGQKSGVYKFISGISVEDVKQLSSHYGYTFHHLNGKTITNQKSFYAALTQTFKWPEGGKGNWDAIFDVITNPYQYQPTGKGIILFDECQNFAKSDAISYNMAIRVFKAMPTRIAHYLKHSSMQDKEFRVYILLSGHQVAFEALTKDNLPIQIF